MSRSSKRWRTVRRKTTKKQRENQERVAIVMRDRLDEMKKRFIAFIHLFSTSYRVAVNADGTVDAELRFSDFARGFHIEDVLKRKYRFRDLFLDAEQVIRELWDVENTWIGNSIVFERTDTEVESEIEAKIAAGWDEKEAIASERERYDRFRGMNKVSTFYQRVERFDVHQGTYRSQIPDQMETARTMTEKVQKRFRRKIQQLVIRFHWNVGNEKPKRRV